MKPAPDLLNAARVLARQERCIFEWASRKKQENYLDRAKKIAHAIDETRKNSA